MIDNLKTRNIALILTPFRSTEVFKDRIFCALLFGQYYFAILQSN